MYILCSFFALARCLYEQSFRATLASVAYSCAKLPNMMIIHALNYLWRIYMYSHSICDGTHLIVVHHWEGQGHILVSTMPFDVDLSSQGPRLPWWRYQMETFSALLALCAGNSPVTGEFTTQRPVTRSFDIFFDLRLIIRLSKQRWGWWFETPLRPLWRHCNATKIRV